MRVFDDMADILIELVARGGGNETLDPLYDLIADHPGSTSFTMEEGRDALLVATARAVSLLAEGRRNLAGDRFEAAAGDLLALTQQFGRLAKLALFLERSGHEALVARAMNLPVGPLNPFKAPESDPASAE